MKETPKSEVYAQRYKYLPWGIITNKIIDLITQDTPQNGSVLDLMCGHGYLLGGIAKQRSDLSLEGIDKSETFISVAEEEYPKITFHLKDVFTWKPTKKYDLVVCTGGIHHLPYDKQESFLKKIPSLLKQDGFCILSDRYIDDYSDEIERKLAVAKMGYEYLIATIKNGAPYDSIKATIDILDNDIKGVDFKTSLKKIKPVFNKIFSQIKINKAWPETDSEYGDYYIVCRS